MNEALTSGDVFGASDSFDADDSFGLRTSPERSSSFGRKVVLVFYVLALLGTLAALTLALPFDADGLAVAATGGAAYASAVVSDTANRRLRLSEHGTASRPRLTAGLRVVVFAVVLLVVWAATTGTSPT